MSGLSTSTKGVEDLAVANAAAITAGFGAEGQSWQDLTASRVLNTTYTNSTGMAIAVAVAGSGGGPNALWMYIDGLSVSMSSGGTVTYGSGGVMIVPNGSTYKIVATGSFSIARWHELRA